MSTTTAVIGKGRFGNLASVARALKTSENESVLFIDEESAPEYQGWFSEIIDVKRIGDESRLLNSFRRRFDMERPDATLCCYDRLGPEFCHILEFLGERQRSFGFRNCYFKSLMRQTLAKEGIDLLPHRVVRCESDVADGLSSLANQFPLLLKPVCGTSSQLVFPKLERPRDVWEAWKYAFEWRKKHASSVKWNEIDWSTSFLLERWIDGQEFTVEGVCDDRTVDVLAVVQKEFALESAGGTYGEGANFTPPRVGQQVIDRMSGFVNNAIQALGLRRSAFHVEIRWGAQDDCPHVIEVNPRQAGGTTVEMVEALTGINLTSYWLHVAHSGRANFKPRQRGNGVWGDVPLYVQEPGVYEGIINRLPLDVGRRITLYETMRPGTVADPKIQECYFAFAYLNAADHDSFFDLVKQVRASVFPLMSQSGGSR